MKKTISLLLAAILLLSMLSGCGTTALPETATPPLQTEDALTEELLPPEQTSLPAEEETEPVTLPGLLANKEALDAAGVLWYVPNELLEVDHYQDIYIVGENLLMTRLSYSGDPYGEGASCTLHLAMLSIETGALLYETALTDVVSTQVQICEDIVAVSDRQMGHLTLLNAQLNLLSEHTLDPDWNSVFLNSDATVLYALTGGSGICVTDLATGEQTWQLEHLRDVYATAWNSHQVSFSCVDLSTQFTAFGVLNLSSGDVTFFPHDGSYFGVSCCSDVWLASVPGEDGIFLIGADEPALWNVGTGSAQLRTAGDSIHLLSNHVSAGGDLSMMLYAADGTFLSSAAQPMFRQAYCTPPIWSDLCGGYLFTVTGYDGKTQLLFWDLSVPMQGDNLTPAATAESAYPIAGTAVAPELYARAAALSEQYGIIIRIADQCSTEYLTYHAELHTDPEAISLALDILEDTLSDYPDGFLEQLCYSSYRELEINLNGALTPLDIPADANGFTSFIAFVEQQDDRNVMVLDIREGSAIRQHIYHEMSHIIDRKLLFDSYYRDGALYSEEAWNALNPEGFEYTLDYYNLPDGIYQDGYDSWFIDTYSRTFPSEDRARILEYAMMGHTYPFGEDSALREKLEFYAACIRDCFHTDGWPYETLWESAIQ